MPNNPRTQSTRDCAAFVQVSEDSRPGRPICVRNVLSINYRESSEAAETETPFPKQGPPPSSNTPICSYWFARANR